MITSGKYAGNYIALNRSKVAVVSKNPILVNEQTMVSFMYQDDIQDISITDYGATGDAVAVHNWLTILKGAGMGDNKVYTISITWRDGAVSIANVTDTQFSKVFATKSIKNPQYAHQQSTVPNSSKTANSQYASQKPTSASVENQASPNAAKEVEKKFFTMFGKFFLLVGIGGAVLISLVSMVLYGKIYMFNGEAYTAALWIVCFLFMAIGMVGVLGATGKEKTSMAIAFAIIGIVILCILFAVGNFFSGIFDGVFGGDGKWDNCHKCGGDGRVENSLGIEVECPQCDGVGFIP